MSNSTYLPSDRTADVRLRLLSMRDSLHNVPKPQRTLVQEAFHELMETIEVLSSADEKLKIQTEQLIRAREQVRAEQNRYKDLLESATDGCVVTDVSGVIQEANRAASIMLNCPVRAIVRRTLTSFVDPEGRKSFREEFKSLPKLNYAAYFEVRLRPHGLACYDASLTASAIRATDGQLAGLRWMMRDITERKRYEAMLLNVSELLQQRR